MSYKATVVADSKYKHNHRISRVVTLECVFPRFILPQINMHKSLCLDGDTKIYFDLPHAVKNGKKARYSKTIKSLYEKLHVGVERDNHNPGAKIDISGIDADKYYTAKQLSDITGKHDAYFRSTLNKVNVPRHFYKGHFYTYKGEDVIRYFTSKGTNNYLDKRMLGAYLRNVNEETLEVGYTHIQDVTYSGKRECFKLTLEDGKSIVCSSDHRFLTEDGWMSMKDMGLTISDSGFISWDANAPKIAVNGAKLSSNPDWLRSQYESGTPIDLMAKEAGVKTRTIDDNLLKFGIREKKITKHPYVPELHDVEWLTEKRKQSLSASMIAKELGVSTDRVKRAFRKNRIPVFNVNQVLINARKDMVPWNKGKTYKQKPGIKKKTYSLATPWEIRAKIKRDLVNEQREITRSEAGKWLAAASLQVHEYYEFKCQICTSNHKPVAHHIYPVRSYPELALEFDNLITLCTSCHRFLHGNHLEEEFIALYESNDDLSKIKSMSKQEWPEWKRPEPRQGMFCKFSAIANIEYVGLRDTYDIAVVDEVNENFIANGMVVHNSKSASSSRALPTNKRIVEVSENPFVPEKFGTNQKGMVAAEPLTGSEDLKAREIWLEGSRSAVNTAQALLDLGVHKEVANRPLEPYMWQTNVVTGNIEFFLHLLELRLGHDAQPEFQTLAQHMIKALNESKPQELSEGEWHLPYVEDNERDFWDIEDLKRISVARCARTSYGSQSNRNARSDLSLYEFLKQEKHYSPFEMVCTPDPEWKLGNIYGWRQLRHEFESTSYYPHR